MAKGKGVPAPPKVKKSADQRVAEATFGMRNKRGGAVQKQIEAMKKSAEADGTRTVEARAKARREAEIANLKAEQQAKADMLAMISQPAQLIQKVPFGVDPKTVVCNLYKKGICNKGKKCKFSHDTELDRKTDKRDLYVDVRDPEEDKKKAETSDDWDEEKLRSVVLSKKGNQVTGTDKVCKFFISAIEDGKYGWFWTCPNGGDTCKYKHALPPGFVLKTKDQRAAEKALHDKSPLKTLTLEEFLESERHKLQGPFTPVNADTFAKWKKDRLDKKAAEDQARKAKDATGRALFESGNWRAVDSDIDSDDDDGDDGDQDDGTWNLQKMRAETERLRAKKEEERLAQEHGGPIDPTVYGGVAQADDDPAEGAGDAQSSGPAETPQSDGTTAAAERDLAALKLGETPDPAPSET